MAKRMLVDATHPEETRVAIVNNNRLEDLDFELTNRKMLKGNIYLAKVIRVEPSLQAAFVEYGGNRHGFLAFSEIHPDYYRIPVGDRPNDEPLDEDMDDEAEGEEDDAILAEQVEAHLEEPEDSDGDDDEPEQDEGPAIEVVEDAPKPVESVVVQAEQQTAPAWSTEPGSGTLEDLIPGYTPPENSSLITGFTPAATDEVASDQSVDVVGGENAEPVRERPRRQHRQRYKIQEVIKRRQVMLIQVVKEERGNKGAALTSFLSLAGRYCVLMPNTAHGGGVSRKITNHQDRRRMKEIMDQLEIPDGMAVILRTAGMQQSVAEIQRDLDYLVRLWNNIREETLQSNAPALIYEEANLLKRALRDLYSHDVQEILVAGSEGYELASSFMKTLVPDAVEKVKQYEDQIPLFFRYNIEKQIDTLHSPVVNLRSGGYLVINPTEALVSIDVNSGRATRERHIEETALKTNLEASDEIARQLRLRDLAGLVVIDFIDMEDGRHNAAVERRMKDAMRNDRARLQLGRISHFGLMELSRQRLRPSLLETSFDKCPHCGGLGHIRSVDSAALSILRAIEEEGLKQGGGSVVVHAPDRVAFYVLNKKRHSLTMIERTYDLHVQFHSDESPEAMNGRIERTKSRGGPRIAIPAVDNDEVLADTDGAFTQPENTTSEGEEAFAGGSYEGRQDRDRQGRGRGRRRGGRNQNKRDREDRGDRPDGNREEASPQEVNGNVDSNAAPNPNKDGEQQADGAKGEGQRRRRRGRRGGRRRNRDREGGHNAQGQGGNVRDDNQGNRNLEQASNDTLDTTPRSQTHAVHADSRQDFAVNAGPRSSMPYEVVDQSSDKPKGGWWRKLTGQ
ncbi:MAG: Rne/Rng family ribonuclease [Alphaproteobacteria bacterium]|nr:Rne/Rng family ribonuclease [Alphaproteobacteria bacterium]